MCREIKNMFKSLTINALILSTVIPAITGGDLLVGRVVSAATISGCEILPADNIWNTAIDSLPVAADSDVLIDSMGRDNGLHPDFGSGTWDGAPIGIPINIVDAGQSMVEVTFVSV